ncbi:MAG: hypothetical protein ACYCO9_06370 [Streptosporangiaceae bacterium]
MSGPFETEGQARGLPEVRAITALPPGTGQWKAASRDMLACALEAAGVEMGAYDERIASWLAGFEPQMVAVIASWITRAGITAADREIILAALDAAAGQVEMRSLFSCDVCPTHPDGLCDTHAAMIAAVTAYRSAAARLAGQAGAQS